MAATLGLAAVCWVVSVWQMTGMDVGGDPRLAGVRRRGAGTMMAAMMLPGIRDMQGDSTMTSHRIGTREEWLAASAELLEREKQLTRMGDELARQRRALPWVPVEKEYTLQTEEGARTLAELFDGRSQLVVYHFMFGPGYTAGCPACSSTADGFNGVLAHLQARDVTMICVSRAPLEKLLAYRERMGWSFAWASSHDSDFNVDFGVSAGERMTAARPRRGPNRSSSRC